MAQSPDPYFVELAETLLDWAQLPRSGSASPRQVASLARTLEDTFEDWVSEQGEEK